MPKTYNTFTNVSVGSVLTASDYNDVLENIENYREPPMVKCVRSGDQNLGSPQVLQWNGTDAYDTDGMHDPSSNNTRITFQTAGIYLVVLNVNVTLTGSAVSSDVYITGGGAATPLAAHFLGAGVSVAVSQTVTTFVDSSAYSYVEANVNFPSAAVATLKANDRSSFSALWIGQKP